MRGTGPMRLTSWEEERLLIFTAAELARRHRERGLLLNAPEAIAIICDEMLEAARAGLGYGEVEAAGRSAVAPADVLPGVRELVDDVRLEVLLEDGTRLVVLVDPLAPIAGAPPSDDGPGGVSRGPGRTGRDPALERRDVVVENTSRRVVRVSSHFPFDQVNARLRFDRAVAAGFHLDIVAGDSERWSPGETRTVRLVRFAAADTKGSE